MHTEYTKAEFIKKYDGKDKLLENFFKHIDRYTPDFFEFFSINPNRIQNENSRQYEIPFEVAELLAGLMRSYSSAYGTDRRKGKTDHGFRFTYDDYHICMESLLREMEKMQPYQRELIRAHRSYRNAVITDRFLPIVTERIAMLIVTLFDYGSDQSSDDFLEVIAHLETLIEDIFKSRTRINGRGIYKDAPIRHQEYTFEDAISLAFNVLANSRYNFPISDQIQLTSPVLVGTILDARREENAVAKKQTESSSNKIEEFREHATQYLNKAVPQFAKKALDFEEKLDDAEGFFNGFWDAKAVSDRLTQSQIFEARSRVRRAVDMACGQGEYSGGFRDDPQKELSKRATKAIYNDNLIKLNQVVEDLHIYDEFYPYFPYFRGEAKKARANGKTYDEIVDAFVAGERQSLCSGAEFQSQVAPEQYRDAICQYHQQMISDPAFKKTMALLNEAVAQLLPVHMQKKLDK